MYEESTCYISAHAKLSSGMASEEIYKVLDVGCIIDMYSGEIVDMSITLVTEETRNFIKSLVLGYNLNNELEPLLINIKKRFHGASQKAVCVVLRLIHEKYLQLKRDFK